jgi:hypothetical protein
MTENIEPQEDTNPELEKPAADTAFLMIKDWDGTWKATTDVSMALTIERRANRTDVKTACHEIHAFLENVDLATIIASKLSAPNVSDTERAAQSVRQALSDRENS